MHRANLYVSAFFLTAALAASGSVVAAAATPNDEHVQVRVYDSWRHDYHNWDEREDRAYQNERHETYLAYEHQKHKYQHNYWNWRHSHRDHD